MKIAFMHTNGYDAILLENGTWFQPESKHIAELLNGEDFTDWNGNELLAKNNVAEEAEYWSDKGAVLVAYLDSEGISIEDEDVWKERLDFYGV